MTDVVRRRMNLLQADEKGDRRRRAGGRAGEGKTALSKWTEVRKGKKETRREAW